MGAVDVKQTSEHELTLEWDSSASNEEEVKRNRPLLRMVHTTRTRDDTRRRSAGTS